MSLLARGRIGDDNAGSTWADRVGDGGQEGVPIDRHVGVLGDEFADLGGDGVDQRDHERDERREESGEGSEHLSISFVLHSLSEGVRHVETEIHIHTSLSFNGIATSKLFHAASTLST